MYDILLIIIRFRRVDEEDARVRIRPSHARRQSHNINRTAHNSLITLYYYCYCYHTRCLFFPRFLCATHTRARAQHIVVKTVSPHGRACALP